MATSTVGTTHSAASRGDRLNPDRSHRTYWHLTCLRRVLEDVIAQHVVKNSGSLVDYGCGNMPYRPLFERSVQSYSGFDLPGNEMAEGVFDPDGVMRRESHSADYVLSSQVLEHVVDPQAYLAEARRVLRDDGKLILSTHGVWRYHPDPTDFWRWTSDGLKKLITESGYEIVSFEGIMGPAATAIQLWQDATLPRVHPRLKKPFTWTLQRLMERADSKCAKDDRNRDGCVYVVVATKAQLG